MVAFLVLLYAVYMGAIVVFGLGLYLGIFNGPGAVRHHRRARRSSRLLLDRDLPGHVAAARRRRAADRAVGRGPGARARIMAKVVDGPGLGRRPACAPRSTSCATASGACSARSPGGASTSPCCGRASTPSADPPPFAVIVHGLLRRHARQRAAAAGRHRRRRRRHDRRLRGVRRRRRTTRSVAVLTYRAFAFWLPTLPGAIAYFQLRRRVAALARGAPAPRRRRRWRRRNGWPAASYYTK